MLGSLAGRFTIEREEYHFDTGLRADLIPVFFYGLSEGVHGRTLRDDAGLAPLPGLLVDTESPETRTIIGDAGDNRLRGYAGDDGAHI